MELRRSAAIVGIGELRPSRHPDGRPVLELLAEVTRLAIADAGLEKGDVDGLLVAPPLAEHSLMWPTVLAEYLRMHPTFAETVDLGGASACGMVWRAAAAIRAGLCRAAVCVTGDVLDPDSFYGPRGGRPARVPGASSRAPSGRWGPTRGTP